MFCFDRSLIASYIGNIVGALFVGLPAVYMYLRNYDFTDTELKNLENGGSPRPTTSTPAETIREVFQVDAKAT